MGDRIEEVREELDDAQEEVESLRVEVDALRTLLDRSVRLEPAVFDGERGCQFLVGENHVVAEWRGDGVASDHVFAETPELEYLVTTTPHDRCCRMVLGLAHWEVVAAMLRGAGDGQLRPMSERADDVFLSITIRQDIAGNPLAVFMVGDRTICTQYVNAETAERLVHVTEVDVWDERDRKS